VQPILHDTGSNQHIYQDEILAPILVHLQHPTEDKNPKQSMANQKCDKFKDQWNLYQRQRKKVASQLQPSDRSESQFSQYAASLRANGHILVVT
jgi:hypothetical protein